MVRTELSAGGPERSADVTRESLGRTSGRVLRAQCSKRVTESRDALEQHPGWPRGALHGERSKRGQGRWGSLGTLCGLAALAVACTDTPIDLIWAEHPTDPEPSGTGGATSSGGSASAGGESAAEGGQGGAIEPCAGGGADHYQLRSGELCLGQGDPTTIAGEPAYRVGLAPCDDSAVHVWSVRGSGPAYEFRQIAVAHNLDVRLAATGDGTTLVLYEPHQLYNQRFFVRSGPAPGTDAELSGGARWLAPQHVDSKCITVFPDLPPGSQVQIWPCDESWEEQKLELVPVVCP